MIIWIVIGIAVTVAVLIGLDLYASENLQLQTKSTKSFDWADLSTDMVISVCNPTFMPTSFDKIQADFAYKSTDIGMFTIWGSPIWPYSSSDVNGRLNLNGENVLKIVLGGMLSAFSGQTSSQLDTNNFNIHLKFEKKILGVIPYSYEKDFPISEFTNLVHGNKWSCGTMPQTNTVQIQQSSPAVSNPGSILDQELKLAREKVAAVQANSNPYWNNFPHGTAKIGNVNLDLEVANTSNLMQQGLQSQSQLLYTQGMLFVLDTPTKVPIWMPNMKFSIDIIWFDETGNILHIEKNVPPCYSSDTLKCPIYGGSEKSKYVLEVTSGFVDKFGISTNSQLTNINI